MSDARSMQTGDSKMSLKLAISLILAVTLWRVVLLRFNATDLFVDEAQYWFWGQNLDFGYYSKPPMIAWVIRLFNEISGSDSTFWVRLSAPLFHMATAFALMCGARRIVGPEFAPWVGVTFVTLPAASFSSLLVSTDTIQILFLAIALWAFFGLNKRASVIEALVLGVSLGLAFLTKYSILFVLPGVGIAMLTLRSARIAWRDVAIAAVAGAIVVSPNIWWNLAHDIATVRHTGRIAHWSDGGDGGFRLNIAGGAEFLLAQFGVVGPIVFYAMLWAAWRVIRRQGTDQEKLLVWLSVPVVLLITLQALFAKAYANWAVTAYAAGTILAVYILTTLTRRAIVTSFVINAIPAVLLPVLAVFAGDLRLPNGDLVMKRYMGRSIVSMKVADIAQEAHTDIIVAEDRDILADLYYTLKGRPYRVFARHFGGFPKSYYEQNFSLPDDTTGDVLYVATGPFECADGTAETITTWQPDFGYKAGKTLYAYRVPATCLAAQP